MLGLSPEILIGAAYGALLLLVAVGQFFREKAKAAATPPPSAAGFAAAWGEHEQTERIITQLARIADALSDKKADEMTRRLETMAEAIDKLRVGHSDLLGMVSGPSRRRR